MCTKEREAIMCMKERYTSIGLMSGTSLDGLDVCAVIFEKKRGGGAKAAGWSYEIAAAKTYRYPQSVREKLANAQSMSAKEFVTFHSEYGFFLGEKVKEFIKETRVKPDIIASHGHTIFHEPQKKVMCQIGDGAAIAATCGVPTVCDFRRLDIMLGGQGAPLVPIGDRILFGDYDYCLNIGGFSNISYESKGQRIAFDISPVNYVINHYCRQIGKEFDRDGEIAKSGRVDADLLQALNTLPYYSQRPPKSLGREWVEKNVFPLLNNSDLTLEDKLRTFYEHITEQVAAVTQKGKSLLATGGGAYNKFLIERIKDLSGCDVIIPDATTIEYKEALIFALLGVLYMEGEVSCLSSVTGACKDNIGGALFKVD